MPELPEVEVVKRSLNRKVQNLIIKKVKIINNLNQKIIILPFPALSNNATSKIYYRNLWAKVGGRIDMTRNHFIPRIFSYCFLKGTKHESYSSCYS